MALKDEIQAQVAYKKLYGKTQTDDAKGLNNEQVSSSVILASNSIFLDSVPEEPSQAVQDGVAEYIQNAEFQADPTSNGHAFFLNFPSGSSSTGVIKNAIPVSFGSGYQIEVYDINNNKIPILDSRNWIYDYSSGTFFQQTPNATPEPAFANLYRYTGATLKNLNNTSNLVTDNIANRQIVFSDNNSLNGATNVFYNKVRKKFGIETAQPNSTLSNKGSYSSSVKKFLTQQGSSDYQLTENDYTLLVDSTNSKAIISLPDAKTCEGRIYNIKRISEDPNGFKLIGEQNQKIDNEDKYENDGEGYPNVKCQSDGENWWII